jgi:hypothetical protein
MICCLPLRLLSYCRWFWSVAFQWDCLNFISHLPHSAAVRQNCPLPSAEPVSYPSQAEFVSLTRWPRSIKDRRMALCNRNIHVLTHFIFADMIGQRTFLKNGKKSTQPHFQVPTVLICFNEVCYYLFFSWKLCLLLWMHVFMITCIQNWWILEHLISAA